MFLRFADCELDTNRRSLKRNGEPIPVEPQVFDLILLLAENSERLVMRDEIIDQVWSGRIVSESAVSARIASARAAVGDDGKRQSIIRTVHRRGLEMVVPVVTVEVTDRSPAPASPVLRSNERLRYLRGRGGTSIAYRVRGEGSPVIRVSPAAWDILEEQTSSIWKETGDWLSRHHQQLRFSTNGSRDGHGTGYQFDFDELAEDIERVAEAAGFDRFAILADSSGFHPAIRFTANHPERVSRMVITGGYIEGRAQRTGPALSDDVFRQLVEKGWHNETAKLDAAIFLPYLPEGPLEAIIDAARVFQATTTREEELAQRDAINSVDSSSFLKEITCPVLIVHGRHDAIHPVSEAQKLAEELLNAELWIMETANHLPVAGHRLWEEYKAGVLAFLEN